MKNIHFWCPYPYNTAPGQRFRYEQYLKILEEKGFQYKILSFLSPDIHKILYQKGQIFRKILGVTSGYFRRFGHLFQALSADYIFIYREAAPLGPAFFEFCLAKVFRKKIIYDFDDAIWIPVVSEQNKLAGFLKNADKVRKICRLAHKISAGNAYLCRNAADFRGTTEGVVLNPTTIDTENMHNSLKKQDEGRLTVGWTGTHSTLCYLREILPALRKLSERHDFDFLVICNENPNFNLKNFRFLAWREESEINDLLQIHVGVMPLTHDAWAEGKCGFKALQYMALGIPAVISPVGVNKKIISEGEDGFLCETEQEWIIALEKLLSDAELRAYMGKNARQKILREYSVLSNTKNFLSLFEN
jgi:glycosyltransferase involved in cell wall biosynthesis